MSAGVAQILPGRILPAFGCRRFLTCITPQQLAWNLRRLQTLSILMGDVPV